MLHKPEHTTANQLPTPELYANQVLSERQEAMGIDGGVILNPTDDMQETSEMASDNTTEVKLDYETIDTQLQPGMIRNPNITCGVSTAISLRAGTKAEQELRVAFMQAHTPSHGPITEYAHKNGLPTYQNIIWNGSPVAMCIRFALDASHKTATLEVHYTEAAPAAKAELNALLANAFYTEEVQGTDLRFQLIYNAEQEDGRFCLVVLRTADIID